MEKQFGGFTKITYENVSDFSGAGVWIMFGTSKDSNRIDCLNVGKTKDVMKELKRDFERINSFKEPIEPEAYYYNQFGEYKFTYPIHAERIDHLYKEIGEKYNDVFAIKVVDVNSYNVEKWCAYLFKACYWVSNGRYRKKVGEEKIKEIFESIDVSEMDLATKHKLIDLNSNLVCY